MKSKKASFVIKILLKNNFVLVRSKGSHSIFKNGGITLIVPYHGLNREIPIGTLMAIIKQSGLDKDLFI
ncbi:MAG: type II toxin-antitoxin system HicA family toxin [Candidatus Nomurabacteria bacterium]|nr:type II toxin-antitoxin system HicA family toxin [Candidatus Nomurabacteria bacterium]